MARLAARIEMLERCIRPDAIAPRINVMVLAEDQTKPLFGYRVGAGTAAFDVTRVRGETDAELKQRLRAMLDEQAEEGILHLVMEMR